MTDLSGAPNQHAGWTNVCTRCGRTYWVRAIDVSAAKARRFVSSDSDQRHDCQAPA